MKFFSTVVFVVNFGNINFIGHVQAHELFITMLSVDGMSLANIPFNKYFKFVNKIHDMYAEKNYIISYEYKFEFLSVNNFDTRSFY